METVVLGDSFKVRYQYYLRFPDHEAFYLARFFADNRTANSDGARQTPI